MPREGTKFSRSVSFVWIAIVIILLVFSGWYFRYRGQAGTTVNAPQVVNEVLTSGLVGHWTFDGPDIDWDATNEILDRTANNYDGNIGGSLSATSAKIGRLGQALTFNGTSDYIDLGALDVSGSALTIQAWIFVTDSSGFTDNDRIISKATGSNEADHYWMMSLYDNNALRVRLRTGTTTTTFISEDNALQSNTWQHIAFVYDGATVELYTNGRDVGGGAKTGTLATSGAVNANIGRNPGSNGNYFPGIIDDVRIYSTALSASDIFQLSLPGKMTVNTPVEDSLSQGLLGYWKLDEGTGTSTVADSSGNGNSGTMNSMESGDWVAGKIGPYALAFDGGGEQVAVADPASGILDFGSGEPFSVSFWFNPDSVTTQTDALVDKRTAGTGAGYSIQQYEPGGISYNLSDGTDNCVGNSSGFSSAGVWYHAAMTWKDSVLRMYVDGEQVDESSCPLVGDLSNTQPLTLGAEPDYDSPYSGKLDDIRVYGHALSSDDILKLYQTTAPTQPVDTGLVGHWTFDGPDIAGTTAIDRSSFGNNGTITGAVPTIGKLGQGMEFDGDDSMGTSIPLSSLISNSTATLSAWVKPGSDYSASGVPNYLDCIICDSDYIGIFRGQYTAIGYDAIFAFNYDGNNDVQLAESVSVGSWSHIALIHGSGNLSTYVNGTFIGSAPSGNTQDLSDTFSIGDSFDGSIDDVRVYNVALSGAQIMQLYQLGK